MDIFEFIQRSEWPFLVGGTLWYFRKPLTTLLNQTAQLLDQIRLTKVSAFGGSIEFDLKKTAALIQETPKEALKQLGKPQTDEVLPLEVSEWNHPQIVVLKSWNALEAEVYQASGLTSTPGAFKYPWELETSVNLIGLTAHEVEAVKSLRNVRNRVAHEIDFPLSLADAVRFYELARDLIVRIRTLKPAQKE